MDMISLQGKTNFFEKRVSDYAKAGVHATAAQSEASAPAASSKSLYVGLVFSLFCPLLLTLFLSFLALLMKISKSARFCPMSVLFITF